MKTILIVATAIIALASCTDNQRARQFGGTETVDIPEGRILVNCTWKQDDLWLLTKDTATGEMYFNEKSSWGGGFGGGFGGGSFGGGGASGNW